MKQEILKKITVKELINLLLDENMNYEIEFRNEDDVKVPTKLVVIKPEGLECLFG